MRGIRSRRQLWRVYTFFVALAAVLLSVDALATENKHTIGLVSFVNAPYIFEKDSEQKGLMNQIISRLFKRAKVNYTLQLMPKKRALLYTEQTDNTCVLPIARNQEREAKFVWISPVLISVIGLYQTAEQANKSLITLADAQDYRIGSHLGSASGLYLEELAFKVDYVPLNSANIYKLKAGRIDYWESDRLTAKYLSQETNIKLSHSQLDFFTHLQAIACSLSTPESSVRAIRESLYEMYHDGSMEKLVQEYR
jgi:polar amino acid transport system substrate-binding protein